MPITLTAETEALVNEKVTSGAYQSADEVINASLRLLRAQEAGRDALRREIMRGVADGQAGRFTACGTDDELEAFADDIIRQGRENLPQLTLQP